MVDTQKEFQRTLAKIALEALPGFALAGSGAIREHGLIDRPTQDIDLFSTFDSIENPEAFASAVRALRDTLLDAGYEVENRRTGQYFHSFVVSKDGFATQIDLALDYRIHPPTLLTAGPVLSLDDAIASKLGALFSRGEARDYLDVDRIRVASGKSDEELLELASNVDTGFTCKGFVEALSRVSLIEPYEVKEYGYSEDDLAGVQVRLSSWADSLVE